jgi:hypothetical protein
MTLVGSLILAPNIKAVCVVVHRCLPLHMLISLKSSLPKPSRHPKPKMAPLLGSIFRSRTTLPSSATVSTSTELTPPAPPEKTKTQGRPPSDSRTCPLTPSMLLALDTPMMAVTPSSVKTIDFGNVRSPPVTPDRPLPLHRMLWSPGLMTGH